MRRYFFDLYNDLDATDHEGKELPDLAAAIDHAIAEAKEMIAASVTEHGRVEMAHRIVIRDEAGNEVGKVRFDEAIAFVRDGAPV